MRPLIRPPLMRPTPSSPSGPAWIGKQTRRWRGAPLLIAVAISIVLVAMIAVSLLGSTISPGMFR